MISDAASKTIRDVLSPYEPDRCILFGSPARGDDRPDSDYDILVVSASSPKGRERVVQASRLRGAFVEHGMDVDVVLKSPDEVEYYRDKIGHVVKHALAEGIALW